MTKLLDVTRSRLKPPANLSRSARDIFKSLVAACDPAHFTPADLPLLVAYANACALSDTAQAEIDRDGAVVGGRASPWIVVLEKAGRTMVALSLRLRLAPQSRLDPRTATLSRGRAGSRGIESLTRLQGHTDDDE